MKLGKPRVVHHQIWKAMSRPAFHYFMRQIGRRLLAQQLAKQAAWNSMEQGHLASRLKRSADATEI